MNKKNLLQVFSMMSLMLLSSVIKAQDYTNYTNEFCSGTINIWIYNPMPSGFPDLNPMINADTVLLAVSATDTITAIKTGNVYDPLSGPEDSTVYGYKFRLDSIPAGIYNLTLGGKTVTGNLNIKSVPHVNILTPTTTPGHPGLATCGSPVPVQIVIEDTAFQYIWKKVGDTTNVLIPDQSGTVNIPLNTAYRLSVVTGHGCDVHSNTIYQAVERRSFDQGICIVTTDPTNTYNTIVWDKAWLPERPSQYLIYRASLLIGAVSADTFTLSEFRDTVNVNAQQYSYYIKTINTCGDTSGLDFTTDEHSPIYLRNIEYNEQGGYCQIDWERYLGSSGGSNYSVYALDENASDWVLISQPDDINIFKDFNYLPGRKYQIRLDAHTCESARATYQAMSNTRSLTTTGISPIDVINTALYPNPTTDFIFLSADYDTVDIFNVAGQYVTGYKLNSYKLDVSGFDSGVYIIKAIKSGSIISTARFFKF